MVFGMLVTTIGQIGLSDISDDADDLMFELHCIELDTKEIRFGTYPQAFTVICEGIPEEVGNDTPTILCADGRTIPGWVFICKTSPEGLLEDLSWSDVSELTRHIGPFKGEYGTRLTVQGAYIAER